MEEQSTIDVSNQVFERAADLFGLLGTPIRLRIIRELCGSELNVSELLARIKVTQPNMSQHLGLLYRAGLVSKRREGAQMFYQVSGDASLLVCASVGSLLSECVHESTQMVLMQNTID